MAYLVEICKKGKLIKEKSYKEAPENEVFRGFLSI